MALGQAKVSLLLACLRKLILLIPLIFILPLFIQNKVFAVFLAGGLMGWLKEGIWLREGRFTLRRQKGFHLHCVCALHPDLCLTVQQSPWAVAAHRANLTLIFPGRLKQKVRSVALTELAFLQQAER